MVMIAQSSTSDDVEAFIVLWNHTEITGFVVVVSITLEVFETKC